MRIVIALPVLNEERILRASVERLLGVATIDLSGHEVTVVIADNGSDDATDSIGRALEHERSEVKYLRTEQRGKGLAIRAAWQSQEADIFVFMDADLSTDLAALGALVGAVQDGAGIAIGSRFHEESIVERSWMRKVVSRGYRMALRLFFWTKVNDVPCGFKAASAEAVEKIVPEIRNDHWFFDTELVIRAEKAGYRIVEVPVIWREVKPEGRRSKVNIPKVAMQYLKEMIRLKRDLT